MDQRIERSRAALRMAVFQLLQQQPYEAITVDDIARRAGVARSTFYVHFEDKDQLLRASLAAPLDLLSQLVADPVPHNVIVAARAPSSREPLPLIWKPGWAHAACIAPVDCCCRSPCSATCWQTHFLPASTSGCRRSDPCRRANWRVC